MVHRLGGASHASPQDPPDLDRGFSTVAVVVGTEGAKQEFLLHKDLICATSAFFTTALSSPFLEGQTQKVELPEDEGPIFACLADWLYAGRFSWQQRGFTQAWLLYTEDLVYLKLYKMAHRLMLPGLQLLAYNSVIHCFEVTTATIPSREFLIELFDEEVPLAMQMWVVEHIAYWLPKTKNKQDWAQLFAVNERFGTEMALAMVRSQSTETDFLHPRKQHRFAENHGLELEELAKEARSGDKPLSQSGDTKNELSIAQLIVVPEKEAAGVKRPASEMSSGTAVLPSPAIVTTPIPAAITPPNPFMGPNPFTGLGTPINSLVQTPQSGSRGRGGQRRTGRPYRGARGSTRGSS